MNLRVVGCVGILAAAGCAAGAAPAVTPAAGVRAEVPLGSGPTGPLTLAAAQALAEARDPELSALAHDAAAAEARASGDGAWADPVLGGRVEGAPLDGRTLADAEGVVGVSKRAAVGGRPSAAAAAARAEAGQIGVEREARRAALRARVGVAFADAWHADRVALARAEDADLTGGLSRVARARVAAGDLAAGEGAGADLAEARAALDARRAAGHRTQALGALAAAIAVPGLQVPGIAGEPEGGAPPGLESCLATLDAHPAARAAAAAVVVAVARRERAAREAFPDVTVDVGYRYFGTGADRHGLDLGLSLPLPLFGATGARVVEAQAAADAATDRARGIHDDVEAAVRAAHAAWTRADAEARLLGERVVPAAAALVAAAEARHRAGDTALADVLLARRAAIEARLQWLDATRDAARARALLGPVLAR